MNNIAWTAGTGGGAFALRPGVLMPEWSFVTDPAARAALAAVMAVTRWAEKWSGLGAAEDRVWQAVLRGFARSGRAPDEARLAAATGVDERAVASILGALCLRDLIVLDEIDATRVTAAYPFCAWETGHRVRLGATGATVGSLCAIDALGAGAMLGCDAAIESSCRGCGVPIRIATRGGGHALRSVAPTAAVVWAGIRYAGGCSATSGCTVMVFFCSDEHLVAWRERADPDGTGFRLSAEAALQVGKALFVPMLAAGPVARGEPPRRGVG
jgi:hypothetical protein